MAKTCETKPWRLARLEMDIQNLERMQKFYQNALTETQGRLLEARRRLAGAQLEGTNPALKTKNDEIGLL